MSTSTRVWAIPNGNIVKAVDAEGNATILRHELMLRHQTSGLQQRGFGFLLVGAFCQRKELGDLFRNL